MRVTAQIITSGNIGYVRQIVTRLNVKTISGVVSSAWKKWVTGPSMTQLWNDQGQVSGEQPRWQPLSHWTTEQKGSSTIFKSGVIGTGKMSQGYRINEVARGARQIMYTLYNVARGRGGVDYPSILDRGIQNPYTIYPISPNKLLSWKTATGGRYFFEKTHHRAVTERPHIRFFGRHVDKLAKMITNYIATGRP